MSYPPAYRDCQIAVEVLIELQRARCKFPDTENSAHEGYAVLPEEVRGLEKEVFWGKENRARRVREEALQVAAMAIRLIVDVCDPEITPPPLKKV